MENQFENHNYVNEHVENRQDERQQPTHQFTPQYIQPEIKGNESEQPANQSYQNQPQTGHAQSQQTYQSQPQTGHAQSQQTYQNQPYTVQIPEYSMEQKYMQEQIKADKHGLIQHRETTKVTMLIMLILASIIGLFNLAGLIQLSFFRTLIGADVRRFSSFEINVISTVYFIVGVLSVVSLVALLIVFWKIAKIRVESVAAFEKPLKLSMITCMLSVSGFFFFAAFWLMASSGSYWLIFIFESLLAIVSFYFIFQLVKKAERIFEIVEKASIRNDERPIAELTYYQPIGYRTETYYGENGQR